MRNSAYSSRRVQSVDAAILGRGREAQAVVVGVDVSKGDLRLVLRWADGQTTHPLRARQPQDVRHTTDLLRQLAADRDLIVALEPTGRYSDILRFACHRAGIAVHRVGTKVSHDYAEVFDGVPSQHDGKDAALIAELAAIGKSRAWPWPQPDDWERELALSADFVDAYQRQRIVWLNRVEAWLAAHWPELQQHLGLTRLTLLRTLAHYGGPAAVAASPEAESHLRRWGSGLSFEKVQAILASARNTVGVEVAPEDATRIKLCAEEVLRADAEVARYQAQLARLSEAHPGLRRMAAAVGPATAGVLWSEAGDPGQYACARAYLKVLGLNLAESSSGRSKEWNDYLHITKRGSARSRRWLYFAAMRTVRYDSVKRWYAAKVARDGGVRMKALTAVMRRLALALHHMASYDEEFHPARLFAGPRRRRRSRRLVIDPAGGDADSFQEV